jgi:CheY-like chemotaxis protein
MCVLVVEDDNTLGKLFMRHLRQLGYGGDLASSAEEAIERVKSKVYGLIIMDVGLPDKDGLEATDEIRHLPGVGGEQVPIVALTAGHSSREECLKAGMNDYFIKPMLIEQLAEILHKWNPERCANG